MSGVREFRLVDGNGQAYGDSNPLPTVAGVSAAALIPAEYDAISLTYTGAGDVQTVTYRLDGEIVGVLTLSYSAPGVLTGVART